MLVYACRGHIWVLEVGRGRKVTDDAGPRAQKYRLALKNCDGVTVLLQLIRAHSSPSEQRPSLSVFSGEYSPAQDDTFGSSCTWIRGQVRQATRVSAERRQRSTSIYLKHLQSEESDDERVETAPIMHAETVLTIEVGQAGDEALKGKFLMSNLFFFATAILGLPRASG